MHVPAVALTVTFFAALKIAPAASRLADVSPENDTTDNSNSKMEKHQPGGVLEVARIFSKMLEDQFEAAMERPHVSESKPEVVAQQFRSDDENAEVNRRIMMLANLPIVLPRMAMSKLPRVHPSDYDHLSIDPIKLRARIHNATSDREKELPAVEGRAQQDRPRRGQSPAYLRELYGEPLSTSEFDVEDFAESIHPEVSVIPSTASAFKEATADSIQKRVLVDNAPVGAVAATVMAPESSSPIPTLTSTPTSMNSPTTPPPPPPITTTTTAATSTTTMSATTESTDHETPVNERKTAVDNPPVPIIDDSDFDEQELLSPLEASTGELPTSPSSEQTVEDEGSGGGASDEVGVLTNESVEDQPMMAPFVRNPPDRNSIIGQHAKPVYDKDKKNIYVPPPATEAVIVVKNETTGWTTTAAPKFESRNDDTFVEGDGTSTTPAVIGTEEVYGKPYPMQRNIVASATTTRRMTTKTTRKPAAVLTDDLQNSRPAVSPVVALAGADTSMQDMRNYSLTCPPKDQIHPCTCTEHYDEFDGAVETLGMCRSIRNTLTLVEALRGFRGHRLSYLVIDTSHIPPFPNNMLHRIHVDWMEVINSSVQFRREYLQCTIKCTIS